jgi:hypothetical protein
MAFLVLVVVVFVLIVGKSGVSRTRRRTIQR